MLKKDDFIIDGTSEPGDNYGSVTTESTPQPFAQMPLFSSTFNPNHEIFVIPTQEGADKDDLWNGSIGDATMDHVMNMSHKLYEMEHFVHMPNGNIFRVDFNVSTGDKDGSKKAAKDMALIMTSRDKNLSFERKEALYNFLQEEVEENRKREEDKEDALDHPRLSFEDWENFPQMMNQIDIPAPPKPLYFYVGNSKQMFYDAFPEGHPDEAHLNAFINMVHSIDWDNFNEKTVAKCIEWLHFTNKINPKTGLPIPRNWEIPTCPDHLAQFLFQISREENPIHPDDAMVNALRLIDQEWAKITYSKVMKDFTTSGPMQALLSFYKEAKPKHDQGFLVWGQLSKIGKIFFGMKDKVTAAHWNAYKRMKNTLAPRIILGSTDLNRAKFDELVTFFRKNGNDLNNAEKLAKNIFFNRPFMKLEDLLDKKYLTMKDLQGNKENGLLFSQLRMATKKSIANKSYQDLSRKIQDIVELNKAKPETMTEENWQSIYQYYRICKNEVNKVIGDNNA